MLRESTLTVVFIDSSALVVTLGSLAVLLAWSDVAFNFSVVPAGVLPFFVLPTKVGRVSLEASAEIATFVPDGVGAAADAVLLVTSSAEVFQVFVVAVVLPFIAMLDLVLFKSPAGIRSDVAFNFSVVPAGVLPFFVLSTKVG